MERRDSMNDSDVIRFWLAVQKMDDCWLWLRSCDSTGYGRFRSNRTSQAAHRVAYQLCIGPIPPGLTLDHLCKNRKCVNPAHLEPVTLKENILRGDSPFAQHARQEVCKYGHPFNAENTAIRKDGTGRDCLICRRRRAREATRRYRERKRARQNLYILEPTGRHWNEEIE